MRTEINKRDCNSENYPFSMTYPEFNQTFWGKGTFLVYYSVSFKKFLRLNHIAPKFLKFLGKIAQFSYRLVYNKSVYPCTVWESRIVIANMRFFPCETLLAPLPNSRSWACFWGTSWKPAAQRCGLPFICVFYFLVVEDETAPKWPLSSLIKRIG